MLVKKSKELLIYTGISALKIIEENSFTFFIKKIKMNLKMK